MNIQSIQLESATGLKAEVTNFGATLTSLQVPRVNEPYVDVVVGLPNAVDYAKQYYQEKNFYLGATIGRYAGRISQGGFSIQNTFYPIENTNGIQLHGGPQSIDKQVWEIVEVKKDDNPSVKMELVSPTGQNGHPGRVTIGVTYQLLDSALQIGYGATTDVPTVLNLTNHAYFNLNGGGSISKHELRISADQYLELDQDLVPTGDLLPTAGSAYDYKKSKVLKDLHTLALDTPFVLNGDSPQAVLSSPSSGIAMEVYTNQSCMVVFTPRDFGGLGVRNTSAYEQFPAICLECQNFPDAPNQPNFPSALLMPEETYTNTIIYKFV